MGKKALILGGAPIILPMIKEAAAELGYETVFIDNEDDAWEAIDRDPEIRCAIFEGETVSERDLDLYDKVVQINVDRLRVYPVFVSSLKLGVSEDAKPAPATAEALNSLKRRLAEGSRLIERADSLHLYAERCANYRNTLFRIASRERTNLQDGFDTITKEATKALETERVSIWLFDEARSKIVCKSLYCLSQGAHGQTGIELQASDYPVYFSALAKSRSISSDDAVHDSRTSEFASGYLIPLGIASMLDTMILCHGRTIGVLCAEHTGAARSWTMDEQEFAISLADMVSLEIEANEHAKAEMEIVRLNESLETEIEKRTGELAQANAKYEALLTASSEVAIIAMDTAGTISMFNPGAEKMFGHKAEEVVGKHTLVLLFRRADLMLRADELSKLLGRRVKGLDVFLEVPRAEGYELKEWLAVRKGGATLSIQLAVTPIRSPSGEISGYLGIGTDISRLKMAHEEIQALSRQNEMILESVAEGIYGIDAFTNVVFINQAAEKMLGFSAEELLGRSCESLLRPLPPAARQPSAKVKVESKIEATLRDGVPRRAKDESLLRKDGSSLPVEYSVSPLLENGRALGAVVVFQDISERVRQEKDRLRMELELRHAQKLEAIGQLAAGIAHEINTPVQYIGDNLSFLQDSFLTVSRHLDMISSLSGESAFPPDAALKIKSAEAAVDLDFIKEEVPKALVQSIDGVARIAEIVLAMKEFSHPGGADKTFVDLNKAIMTTSTISRNEWNYVAELVTDLQPDLPSVPCLPGEINQVFLNILVNAAHAIGDTVGNTGAKGLIKVQTRQENGMAEVRISDSGTGIPYSIRDRIFEPFFTTKGVGKGTGQGLPIARAIVVQKHGGQLSFESEPGKGTTFIIKLPLKEGGNETGTAEGS